MFTVALESYDPAELKAASTPDEIPRGMRFFRWMHEAFFFRQVDPRSGMAIPLVKIGTDPVRVDASLTLLKWFRDAREEITDGGKGFRLRTAGFTTQLHAVELDLLEEMWRAFADATLGPSDAETVVFVREWFKTIRDTDDKKKESNA